MEIVGLKQPMAILWKVEEHEIDTCFAVMENRLRFWRWSIFWISAFLLSSSSNTQVSFHGKLYVGFHRCQWLPPILSVKAIAYALSQHSGIQLSVLGQAGIKSIDSFASVTNAPPSGVWSTSQSFSHWILLRIPQTRLDLPDSLECRHQF